MFNYFTLDNFDFKGKVVGVRVDINSPVINGKVVDNERIRNCVITIKELIKKGAKVVVLAHQGREGKSDFVSLKEHSVILEKHLKKKVNFFPEVYSKDVEEKIKNLKEKDIILLENLRFLKEEKESKNKPNNILSLLNLFDLYVFDAFSLAHRSDSSVIGFTNGPNIAGRLMERELKGLAKIVDTKSPHMFIFGGAKPDDLIELIESALKKKTVDIIILTGVIGEVALHIKGNYLGKKLDFLKKQNYLDVKPRLKYLLEKHPKTFILPTDIAIHDGKKRIEIKVSELKNNKELLDKYEIGDIGSDSIKYFSKFIKNAGSIYLKGPTGNFEDKKYQLGTKKLLNEIGDSKAFSFLGGGHSVTAAKMFDAFNKFSYISLAGGALVQFLSGKKLPGVEILETSYTKFENFFEDFIVVGSNVLDLEVNVPKKFSEINLGDKIKVNDNFKKLMGGGGLNVSICLSRLYAKVGYLGKLSYESSVEIKECLEKNKINLIETVLTRSSCAKTILLNTKDGDRVIFTYRGQNSDLHFKDFDFNSFKANNFYFTALMGTSFKTQLKLAKKIKEKNSFSKICYNPSFYLIGNEKKLKSLIKLTDILIVNYEEAQGLVGEGKSVSDCLKDIFNLGVELALITDSSHGAYAYDGKREYYSKAVKPKRIVDTTGAGDCFAGTFFYFYTKGFSIKKSLEYAAKNSSSVVSRKGAQDGLLFKEELLKNQ